MGVVRVCVFLLTGIIGQSASGQAIHLLKGKVLDDLTKRGVDRARLSLAGETLPRPLSATSDSEGGFSFQGLPPGSYRLAAEKAGYITESRITVDIDSSTADYSREIILMKKRVIAGRILWTDGEPVVGSRVRATRVIRVPNLEARPQEEYSVTDDDGAFSFRSLSAGRYVLLTTVPPRSMSADSRPRVAAPVYYRNAPSSQRAEIIDLTENTEVSNLSLFLRDEGGGVVSGVLLASASYPAGTEVNLGLLKVGVEAEFLVRTIVHPGEKFGMPDVPSGEYVLVGSVRNQRDGFDRAMWPIKVGSAGLQNLQLSLPNPMPIAGRIVVDGSEPVAAQPASGTGADGKGPGIALRLQEDCEALGPYGRGDVNSNTDGTFVLPISSPGETCRMQVEGLPASMYFSGVRQGDLDITTGLISIVCGKGEVIIHLGRDGGIVRGSVKQDGKPSYRSFVVLAPRDRSRIDWFKVMSTGAADGNFQFTGVAPGVYDVFAFDRNDEDAYLSSEYLGEHMRSAQEIVLGPGKTDAIELAAQPAGVKPK